MCQSTVCPRPQHSLSGPREHKSCFTQVLWHILPLRPLDNQARQRKRQLYGKLLHVSLFALQHSQKLVTQRRSLFDCNGAELAQHFLPDGLSCHQVSFLRLRVIAENAKTHLLPHMLYIISLGREGTPETRD